MANCVGGRFQASAHGTGSAITVSRLFGLVASSPEPKGAGVTVKAGGGLLIEDQMGFGEDDSQGSVFITPQSGGGGSGTKGNIVMAGGGYDDGHINLDSGHLWYDDTFNHFRVSEGAPRSPSDGRAIITGSGKDRYGVLLWADPATGEFDTGQTVCTAEGLTCVSTSDFASMSTSIPCGSRHSSGRFAVQCK